MKKRLVIGFILVVYILCACTPSLDATTPKGGVQPTMEITPEDFAMQTIIAREQLAETPTLTPTEFTNLPKPWTEVTTPTPYPSETAYPTITNPTFATAPKANSIIYQGPGTDYKMACYVLDGTQLLITGRNFDSSWLSVTLGQDVTCYAMVGNIIRPIIYTDPASQFWISPQSYTISGDPSSLPIITPTLPYIYYSGDFIIPTPAHTSR